MPTPKTSNQLHEIDLVNLMFYLLKRWRICILIPLAILLLAFGAAFLKNSSAANSEAQAAVNEEYKTSLAEYEQQKEVAENDVTALTALVAQQEEYLKNSVLMNVDAFSKPVASATVLIQLSQKERDSLLNASLYDPADEILRLYADRLESSMDWDVLASKLKIESVYAKELLEIEPDYDSNTLTVSACASNLETAEQFLDEVLAQLPAIQKEIENAIFSHEVTVTNRVSESICDTILASKQTNERSRLNSYRSWLTSAESTLTKLSAPSAPVTSSRSLMIKQAAKVALIAGIFAFCLIAGCYCVQYVVSGCLRTSEELERCYGLTLLRDDSKKTMPDYASKKLAVALQNATQETILLTGTVETSALEQLCAELQPQLEGKSILVGANLNEFPETLGMISKADGVVFVEKRDVSKMKEIQKEIDTVSVLGGEILGAVVL